MQLSIGIKTNVINSILIICLIYFTVQSDFEKEICYFHEFQHTAVYSFDFTNIGLYETDDNMSACNRCGWCSKKSSYNVYSNHILCRCSWNAKAVKLKLHWEDSIAVRILCTIRLLLTRSFLHETLFRMNYMGENQVVHTHFCTYGL